jgi:very-short-patch-repair endonuclease
MTKVYNRAGEMAQRRGLRKEMTKAEALLWHRIRNRQLSGRKFRRQYSVGPYIMDFYCPAAKLGVEIDWESHYEAGRQEYDRERQRFLEGFGIGFLRFTNVEVYENLDGVLQVILSTPKVRGGEEAAGGDLP